MNTPTASMLEFEEEAQKSLKDYVNVLRRRKRVMGITALSVMLLTAIVAFFWPATYRSESIILIEQQDIPSDLVRTTITSYAQQRIEEIKQRIMTIGNIMEIVEEFELYTDQELKRKTRTEIAQDFRRAVSIQPISAEVVDPRSGRPSMAVIAFSLAFDGDVPSKVQKVTNEITTLYLDENLKERTKQTQSTTDFLTAEANLLEEQLEEFDSKIATFKLQNKDTLPQQNQFNVGVVDRAETQLNELTYGLKELEKRRIQLEGDLSQLSPTAPVLLSTGQAVLGDADRLKALQTQLRQREATYSTNHPDIIRLRREIDALITTLGNVGQNEEIAKQFSLERDRLSALREKYTDDHPEIVRSVRIVKDLESALVSSIESNQEIKPDNPAYLVLKNRLLATEEDIRAAREKISELREKVETYEGYLSKAPEVEREFSSLLRDHQNTYQKYQEIRAKQMSAELAKSLESERKGERFTLIQPPELPIEPVSPNRVALILLGGLLALVSGVGVAILIEATDDAIYSVGEVVSTTGFAPMVSIPYMETTEESSKHNRKRIYIVLGLLLSAVIFVVLFHYFVKPIDVTWFILMRRLGIQ